MKSIRIRSLLFFPILCICILASLSADTTTQNFVVTGFIDREGLNGSNSYGHVFVRNLYTQNNISEGVTIEMGDGRNLYSQTAFVPLFRVEYVTNSMNGVDIKLTMSPFQLSTDGQEQLNDVPSELETWIQATAGLQADYSVLSSIDFIIDSQTTTNNSDPQVSPGQGYYSVVTDGNVTKRLSQYNSYQWTFDDFKASGTEDTVVIYTFDIYEGTPTGNWDLVREIKTTNGTYYVWDYKINSIVNGGDIQNGGTFPGDGAVTNYIDVAARIATDMPNPTQGSGVSYVMDVTVTVEAKQ